MSRLSPMRFPAIMRASFRQIDKPWFHSVAVPFAVGGILIMAGFAKLAYPSSSPPHLPIELHSDAFHLAPFALIIGELCLGLWLLTRKCSQGARLISLIVFSTFAVASLKLATTGAVSCACFGTIPVSPRITLIIDAFILGMLWYWRPDHPLRARRVVYDLASLALGALTILSMKGPVDADKDRDAIHLTVLPSHIDLGTVYRGGSTVRQFLVRNTHSDPVEVRALETTCHCLEAFLPVHELSPEQASQGELRLDLGKVPDFFGNLEMTVRAISPRSKELFRLTVRVQVE